jgi:hypothetical protein
MHHPADDAFFEDELEAEVLISRMIDGEAGDTDRARFELLATAEPDLWRQLALRQQDQTLLTEEVATATDAIDQIELRRSWLMPGRLTWVLSLSGWAALIIVALSWGATALMNQQLSAREHGPTLEEASTLLSPEQHLLHYREAPYVVGDMEPEVLDVEPLSDGRVAVRFVRRFEEVAFLDPSRELPVDENGELTSDPLRLRQSEPQVRLFQRP